MLDTENQGRVRLLVCGLGCAVFRESEMCEVRGVRLGSAGFR